MSPGFELPSPTHPKWLTSGISQRRWYRDGEPLWKKADTAAVAKAEWKKRTKFLRNKGRGDAELKAIGDQLESCRAQQRCPSKVKMGICQLEITHTAQSRTTVFDTRVRELRIARGSVNEPRNLR